MRQNALFLVLGTAFGLVLSRGGATDYDIIQRMFLLESFQLYGILGTAVLVTGLGLRWMEAHGRRAGGAPLAIRSKPFNRGTVAGSLLSVSYTHLDVYKRQCRPCTASAPAI